MFVYKTSLYISANHVTTTHKPIPRKYNITLSSPTIDITTNGGLHYMDVGVALMWHIFLK